VPNLRPLLLVIAGVLFGLPAAAHAAPPAIGGDRPVPTVLQSIGAGQPGDDPWRPLSSPDVGDECAEGLDADDLARFFSAPIGRLAGADYQRALRLPDDRVLWTFQDGFVDGTLVHNVGVVQSGRCFTLLNPDSRSWLLADRTSHMVRWHWILGGGISDEGATVTLFLVRMEETGPSYLSRTRPTGLDRVVLDARTFEVVAIVPEQPTGDDLYGWSVTSDATHTYLYSHCYRQFGYKTLLGFAGCVAEVKVARVPVGRFDAPREYWDGSRWSSEPADGVPVVGGEFVGSGNNPAQIAFDGNRFVLVEKRDDWWGTTVEFGVADRAEGPFVHVASIDEPLGCDRSACNTYFASWVPWRERDGSSIWSVGRNRWDGSETADHLADYRPTFAAIDLRPPGRSCEPAANPACARSGA
jgi:hypothetical protein